jgi:hypothetical protein
VPSILPVAAGKRKAMRPARWLALCALLLVGPTGCITWFIDPMGHRAAFDDIQRQYTQALRWGEIERASAFVEPDLREAFLEQQPIFDAMRITDFSIGEVDYQSDTAKVTVTYEGYSLESFVERKIREDQSWHRESGSNRWLVRSDVTAFARGFGEARR